MRRRKDAPRLRVSGAVRAMNSARQALSAGLRPEEKEEFRRQVMETLAQLEAICRAHRITPQALPGPTFRAYQYLKSIDLQNLPTRADGTPVYTPDASRREEKATLRGVLARCARIQEEMWAIAGGSSAPGAVKQLLAGIQSTLKSIDRSLARMKISPGDLAAPSHRAYGWLKFLSIAGQLELHLQALRIARRAAEEAATHQKPTRNQRNLPVHLEFFNIASLYRGRQQKGRLHLSASEGFIAASTKEIEALVRVLLGAGSREDLHTVRRFSEGEEFAEIVLAISLVDEGAPGEGRGLYFDLETVFERVNREYFSGEIPRPRLIWNRVITRRKLGHYQPSTDTVLISITLDHPEVPQMVIDFVMYHELLHKKLGIPVVNGRRRAHSPEFRREEKKFRQYKEAQEFLKKL